jgi:hypothetical protein
MLDANSLSAIGDGYTTAYYLVHSMGRGGGSDYEQRDASAASKSATGRKLPGRMISPLRPTIETALMGNIEAGEVLARGLSTIGCQLALDDFGTGFGSFTYLKRLPFTYLKVDVDFVRDLATNQDNQHLVRAIVGLARDFGYQTIAEGVEDAETLALVKEYGVNFAQGFHLGRPTPIDC